MRALPLFVAMALAATPLVGAPSVAHADGIERPPAPRPRPRPRPRPPAMVEPPAPAPVAPGPVGPETVTLPQSFFASGGGVGADIGGGSYSSTTVIIRGSASATAVAFASVRASAYRGGRRGAGGHGCGCR